MSNPNKTEINKAYGDMIRNSVSNIINNTTYGITGLNFNEVASTGTGVSHIYSNKTITDCGLQYLTVEMKKEMVIAMNAMMKIKDVEIMVPNKVVKVTFNDDTFEKSVCHEDDTFSLETAITICMTKHLLGGSGKFNNILAKGVKIVEDKVKAVEEAEKEKARIEAKRLKNHNKRVERRKKKEAEARKARIQETAEAIMLANEMMKTEAKNKE